MGFGGFCWECLDSEGKEGRKKCQPIMEDELASYCIGLTIRQSLVSLDSEDTAGMASDADSLASEVSELDQRQSQATLAGGPDPQEALSRHLAGNAPVMNSSLHSILQDLFAAACENGKLDEATRSLEAVAWQRSREEDAAAV